MWIFEGALDKPGSLHGLLNCLLPQSFSLHDTGLFLSLSSYCLRKGKFCIICIVWFIVEVSAGTVYSRNELMLTLF